MFKHFFWFARQPADERESLLLSIAYQHALAATWAGLVFFLFAASPYSGFLRSISIEHAITILEIIIFAGMIAGWTSVRHEHLEFKPISHAHRLPFSKLVLIWIAITLAGMLPVVVQPRLFYVSIFCVFIVFVISTMIWTANWTKSYTLHSRLLAVFLVPFQTIGFLLSPIKPIKTRLFQTVVLGFGVILVPLALWIPFMNSVASASGFSGPVAVGYEHTEGFIPVVVDYRMVGGLQKDDLVQFHSMYSGSNNKKQWNNDFLYGRITSIESDVISVEVLDAVGQSSNSAEPDIIRLINDHHTETVPRSSILAKVITDAPLADWLYR